MDNTSTNNVFFPIWALSHGINSHTLYAVLQQNGINSQAVRCAATKWNKLPYSVRCAATKFQLKTQLKTTLFLIVQELCETRGGRPELSVRTSILVSVDVKLY